MIYISHRGNVSGIDTSAENHPDQIEKVINEYDFYCEIDLWYINNVFYLGHDNPQYVINYEFLNNSKLFIHCKNIAAIYQLNLRGQIFADYFFHDQDPCVLTKNNLIWTYPDEKNILTNQSIAVMVERVKDKWENVENCFGICTDYPINYSKYLNLIK